MIDLHCHIPPGMDDGAASMEAANEMLRLAAESGITDIAATLHANLRYAFEPAAVTAAVAELQAAANGALRLHCGCEMHLTPENIERAIREPCAAWVEDGCLVQVTAQSLLGKFGRRIARSGASLHTG
jgi:protein-tyrosine phosphatase